MLASVQRDFLDPKVLARLAGLPLFARRPMQGTVSGRHRSPARGSSLEFAEYRKYVPGDDTRRLDWRAWGRSDRFYIKEFEADTNLRLCLLLDLSGSMDFQMGKMSKLDYARKLAGTLAFLAARQGDAVGLWSASASSIREIPAKRSAAHLKVILDELGSVKARGETGMVDLMHQVAETAAQRALVVILSDLFFDPEPFRDAVQHLRFRKHDISVFHLLEKHEINFDFDRPTRFVDLEGGPSILADPDVIGNRYRDAMRRYMNDIEITVRDTELDYHRVDIEEPYDAVMARYLLGRTPKRTRA